ncbi:MAG TPA: hypothetical protein VN943_15010 [Candidatus Acidoferrum sp.]|nr:hypothetical protein [Candidatus Acidoferrum sp.]
MRSAILRVLGGVLGLIAGIAAIFLPLLFVSDQLREIESMKQYGGHVSFWGAVGGSLTILVCAGFAALLSYLFLRYALRGNKSSSA